MTSFLICGCWHGCTCTERWHVHVIGCFCGAKHGCAHMNTCISIFVVCVHVHIILCGHCYDVMMSAYGQTRPYQAYYIYNTTYKKQKVNEMKNLQRFYCILYIRSHVTRSQKCCSCQRANTDSCAVSRVMEMSSVPPVG